MPIKYAGLCIPSLCGTYVSIDDYEKVLDLLCRARKFVFDDALMAGAITRHAPLPPEAQAVHDSTEYLSEILLREIDSVLPNAPDQRGA
jgi:hypothetical protein